jgi:ribosomal protein S1
LNQPHIRLIVRGKANAKTEFGAKVEIIVVDGYVRVEKLSWDAYNECDSLIEIVENFKTRTGKYPERVLVDKIYRNRKNLNFCKKNRTT